MNDNLNSLQKKMAIIAGIQLITLASDLGLTYYTHSIQLGKPNDKKTEMYRSETLKSILNTIKSPCYALGALGNAKYLTDGDGWVDTTDPNKNDVSPITTNWPYLLLNLTITVVRTIEFVNLKPIPIT